MRLLAAAESRRARRLRITRWWLLALRCLLLATVIVALAEPRLAAPWRGSDDRAWLLVDPEVIERREQLEAGDPGAYGRLDAWLAEGDPWRWLVPGLPLVSALSRPPERPEATDVWSLFREADRSAPPGAALRLVTRDRLGAAGGSRPASVREVEWVAVRDSAENHWIESASWNPEGRLAVLMGRSSEARTTFESTDEFAVEQTEGGVEIRLEGEDLLVEDDRLLVLAARPELLVELRYSVDRAEDADYLAAGLDAVGEAVGVDLEVVRERLETGEAQRSPREAPLIFRLGDGEAEPELLASVERGATLVTDALGPYEVCSALAESPGGFEVGPIRFERCGPVEAGSSDHVVWRDRLGRALMIGERRGAGRWLRLGSRWNPLWSELVYHAAFVHWLEEVVVAAVFAEGGRSAALISSDRRSVGAAQLLPRRVTAADPPRPGDGYDPKLWLWALVGLLFAGERVAGRLLP